MTISSAQIREKYLKFFADRGHAVIPSAPLVPENDPTTLFTSSGMQPLVPYLLGQKHPDGKRLVNSQKCFRAQDIEEVGDNRHTTFFEMLGNWSLGDPAAPDGVGEAGYFKKEQLSWIFEFLTKELGLDPKRLYVTVFQGNKSVPKDTESIDIWKRLFQSVGMAAEEGKRIFAYPAKKNWWSRSGEPENMPVGEPGGPDSEVFYDFGEHLRTHENSIYKNEQCHPNCDCGRYMEIANSVFMQYQKQSDGSLQELKQKNVDFGGGLERLTAAVNNEPDIFRSDLFISIIRIIEKITGQSYANPQNRPAMKIIADHLKASTFLIVDGVLPSNKAQGYILRRLLRRAAVKLHTLHGRFVLDQTFTNIIDSIFKTYRKTEYFDISKHQKLVVDVISEELNRFNKVLDRGLAEIQKLNKIDGKTAFDLFQSYGFPFEISVELFAQKGQKINHEEFQKEFEKHKELSRTSSKGMFKGGLADHSEIVTKLHTATHLLHAALRKILGVHVSQKGSNITTERLRFDFTHPTKLTEEERVNIETWVNEQIKLDLPVESHETTIEEAQKEGAVAFFADRYGKQVRVYVIGNAKTGIVSREVCGGPHVTHTGELGQFRLGKEESVGTGTRRLYATLS